MRIAVASQNRKQITGHTGRCHRFWIYEIQDGKIKQKDFLELTKEQSFHYASVHEPHALECADVLLCGGLGQGLIQKLARKNINVIVTEEKDIEKAVTDYLAGSLSQSPAEALAHEHDHSESHEHEDSFVQLSTGAAFDNHGNILDQSEGKHNSGCGEHGGCHH